MFLLYQIVKKLEEVLLKSWETTPNRVTEQNSRWSIPSETINQYQQQKIPQTVSSVTGTFDNGFLVERKSLIVV